MLDLVLQLVLSAIAFIRQEQLKDLSISLRENIRPPDGAAQGQCKPFWLELATWIARSGFGFVLLFVSVRRTHQDGRVGFYCGGRQLRREQSDTAALIRGHGYTENIETKDALEQLARIRTPFNEYLLMIDQDIGAPICDTWLLWVVERLWDFPVPAYACPAHCFRLHAAGTAAARGYRVQRYIYKQAGQFLMLLRYLGGFSRCPSGKKVSSGLEQVMKT